jgi:hypothetical protein
MYPESPQLVQNVPTPERIELIAPLGKALRHTGKVLFEPFDMGKWFVIGFCAWLATLGKGGGPSFGYNFNSNSFRQGSREVQQFVQSLPWMIPLVIGASLFGLIVYLLFLWLSSRGKFMFLYCAVNNCAFVKYPWDQFRRQGNSVFLFRLVVGILWIIGLGLTALLGLGLYAALRAGLPQDGAVILAVLGAMMIGLPLSVAFLIVTVVTEDFVIPVMVRQGRLCIPAWKVCRQLIRDHFGKIVLYWLFKILLSIVISAMVFAFVLGTCCIGGAILMIPYLGAVLLLPITCFKRSFSVFYLRQFGDAYDIFPPDPASVVASPAVLDPGN